MYPGYTMHNVSSMTRWFNSMSLRKKSYLWDHRPALVPTKLRGRSRTQGCCALAQHPRLQSSSTVSVSSRLVFRAVLLPGAAAERKDECGWYPELSRLSLNYPTSFLNPPRAMMIPAPIQSLSWIFLGVVPLTC